MPPTQPEERERQDEPHDTAQHSTALHTMEQNRTDGGTTPFIKDHGEAVGSNRLGVSAANSPRR